MPSVYAASSMTAKKSPIFNGSGNFGTQMERLGRMSGESASVRPC
jgi:hypothetical protein